MRSWLRIAHKAVDDAARIRTTIDVIAERHGQGIADGIGLEVAGNQRDHPVKQVRPAVDIANDVNSALIQKVWLRTHEAHVATTAP
jgi:hypothetical protein